MTHDLVVPGEYIFLLFFFGTFWGSFLCATAFRLESGNFPGENRSHCDSCHKKLGLLELIPVFSWLLLRGRCRTCRSPIGRTPIVTELMTGLLFVLALFLVDPHTGSLSIGLVFLILGSFVIIQSLLDIKSGHISVPVSVLAGISGLLASLVIHFPLGNSPFWYSFGPMHSLLGVLVGFGPLFLFSRFFPSMIGEGDAWLLGGFGAFIGWDGAIFAVTIASGTILLWKGPHFLFVKYIFPSQQWMDEVPTPKSRMIPFGPFLGFATLLVFGIRFFVR